MNHKPCKHCGTNIPAAPKNKVFCSVRCRFLYLAETHLGETGCWNWEGAINKSTGYGFFSVFEDGKRRVITAHRSAFSALIGEIPDGIQVLHKCDNRACFNPAHLFLGSQQDNIDDMMEKGRGNFTGAKTHWTKTRPELIKRGKDHHLSENAECLPRGEAHHNAKFNDETVRYVRESRKTTSELSRELGISQSSISSARNRKSWKHVS